MAHKRRTVKQLADEAQIGIDEALLTLWDADFKDVISGTDFLRRGDVNRARRALGVATRREFRTFTYWMKLFNIDESEFRFLLEELGVTLHENSKKLQPKAISRLKSEARKRGIDPITGNIKQSPIPSKTDKVSDFQWKMIGHPRELRFLKDDEVEAIHYQLVKDFAKGSDPIDPPGVRSESLLGSAVFRPRTSLGETLKYPTVEMSAAALLHSIIHDHPFHNGNKRTALVCMLVFLDENGLFPDFKDEEVFKLVLQVAQHKITDVQPRNLADKETLVIADWLSHHCRVLEKGTRPMTFRKLRQILVRYGCTVEPTGGKANISRIETVGSIFKKNRPLHIRVLYGGEGRDVPKNTIVKIRQDLHLDDLHGVDSHAFYEAQEPLDATEFICRYRKTLLYLAKL